MKAVSNLISSRFGEVTMNNGVKIPKIGLGLFQVNSSEHIYSLMKTAYDSGFRLIDSAVMYQNEKDIGYSLKKLNENFGIKREEFLITSKVLPNYMNRKACINSVNQTLKNLGTNYLDILLIHWPSNNVSSRLETWLAMQELVQSKKVLSIGVSNFTIKHLENLLSCKEVNIIPCINQIELHPLYWEQDTIDYCNQKGIVVEAYGPFKRGDPKLLQNEILVSYAKKYNKTTTQVIMRWFLGKNVVILPRSNKEEHVKDNLKIDDFNLSQSEIEMIDKMNIMDKHSWNPHSLP